MSVRGEGLSLWLVVERAEIMWERVFVMGKGKWKGNQCDVQYPPWWTVSTQVGQTQGGVKSSSWFSQTIFS